MISEIRFHRIKPVTVLQLVGIIVAIGCIYPLFLAPEYPPMRQNSDKYYSGSGRTNVRKEPRKSGPLKRILFWNEFFGHTDFMFGLDREPFIKAGCEVDTCMTTTEAHRFRPEEYDAVVWHFRSGDKSLPDVRSPNTKYVFFLLESPEHLNGDLSQFNDVFNWTFTYRSDSDIYAPYGSVVKLDKPVYPPTVDFKSKKKFAAWFASNCNTNSKREKLVQELQKYIEVDVYGPCGKHRCERSENDKCKKMLERDYKFYLSFENSLCQDYVTEKFFDILNYNVIPVVYGAAPYKDISPPQSYVNVLDFDNVKALAKYLKGLATVEEEYLKYFEWKKNYKVVKGRSPSSWCDLCKKLHEVTKHEVYKDLASWYALGSLCKRPWIEADGEFPLNMSLPLYTKIKGRHDV